MGGWCRWVWRVADRTVGVELKKERVVGARS